ncbi:MAG: aminopeptidase P family protein [Bdellovibrionales bacterium]|nr:aminopeptidase P family protein [Bdellovibrionales bacterium]
MQEERVIEGFDLDKLNEAQEKTIYLLNDLATQIRPGMTEQAAMVLYNNLQMESDAERYWHPPKIRFGVNTLKSFREPSEPDVVLKENDIFFLDVGLVFDGYEGDAGRTFVLGQYPEGKKARLTCETINKSVRAAYLDKRFSGEELYKYAEKLASEAGYELVVDGARGHRIGDFPHAAYYKGYLNEFKSEPAPNRWILEIQIRDLKNQVGAFYEDILY